MAIKAQPADDKAAFKEYREVQRRRLVYIAAIVFFLLVGGAVVFHALENWSWLNSLYFATVTLTTVGYGDIVPTHQLTRAFIIVYLLGGVATVLYGLTAIAQYYVEKREDEFEHRLSSLRRLRSHGFTIPRPPTMRK